MKEGTIYYCCTCERRKKRSALKFQSNFQFTHLHQQFFKINETTTGPFCNDCYWLFQNFVTENVSWRRTLDKIQILLKETGRKKQTFLQLDDIKKTYQNTRLLEQAKPPLLVTEHNNQKTKKDQLNISQQNISQNDSYELNCTYWLTNSSIIIKLYEQSICNKCQHIGLQYKNTTYCGAVAVPSFQCNNCGAFYKFHTDYLDSSGAHLLNRRFAVAGHMAALSYPALHRFVLTLGTPSIGSTYYYQIGQNLVYPAATTSTKEMLHENLNKFYTEYFTRFKARICLFFYDQIPKQELQNYRNFGKKGAAIQSIVLFASYQCPGIIELIYSFLYSKIYMCIAFDGSYPTKRNADYTRVFIRETRLIKRVMWRSCKFKQRVHEKNSDKFVGPSNMLEGEALNDLLNQMKNLKHWIFSLGIKVYCHDNDGKARGIISKYFSSVPFVLDSNGQIICRQITDIRHLDTNLEKQPMLVEYLIDTTQVPFFFQDKIVCENPKDCMWASELFGPNWINIPFDIVTCEEELDRGHLKKSLRTFCAKQCKGWTDKVEKAFTWSYYNCNGNSKRFQELILAFPYHWSKNHTYCSSMCSKDDSTSKKRLDLSINEDKETFQTLYDFMAFIAKKAEKFMSKDSTNWNESLNRSILVGLPKTIDYKTTANGRIDIQLMRVQQSENYINHLMEKMGFQISKHELSKIQNFSNQQAKQYEYKQRPENLRKKYLAKFKYKFKHSKANNNAENSYYNSAHNRIIAEVSANAQLDREMQHLQQQQSSSKEYCECTGGCCNSRCICRANNRACNERCRKHVNCTNNRAPAKLSHK